MTRRINGCAVALGPLLLLFACGQESTSRLGAGDAGLRDASAVDTAAEEGNSAGAVSAAAAGDASDRASSEAVVGKVGVEVGSQGGSVQTSTDSVALVFPPTALESTVTITAEPAVDYPPDGQVVPGTAVDFGPDGIIFDEPVAVTVAYDPDALPDGVPERSLRLYKAVGDGWQLVSGSAVDTERKHVSAQLFGFSTYAVRSDCTPPNCPTACSSDIACATGQTCRSGVCAEELTQSGGGVAVWTRCRRSRSAPR
jgi:hypothetical protein